jgi:hypothetical protein
MYDKILGTVLFSLSAASQVLIAHDDTALFYSILFFVLGVYEFVRGELKGRKAKSGQ